MLVLVCTRLIQANGKEETVFLLGDYKKRIKPQRLDAKSASLLNIYITHTCTCTVRRSCKYWSVSTGREWLYGFGPVGHQHICEA
jgi:hypothetical protein